MTSSVEYAARIKQISLDKPQEKIVIEENASRLIQGLLANAVETGFLLNKVKKGLFHGATQQIDTTLIPELPESSPLHLSGEQAETLEALLGIFGEVAELSQMVFLSIKHQELIDQGKACSELGDLGFYITKLTNVLGLKAEEIRELNLSKISSGYTGKLDVFP